LGFWRTASTSVFAVSSVASATVAFINVPFRKTG
jgi:hypothetical protein